MSEEGRFDALVRKHHRAVSAYARALSSDRTVAEDAVQETFLRAWRYLDSFNSSGSFEGWLLTICRRCVIELAQRDQRHHSHIQLNVEKTELDQSADLLDLVAGLPLVHREVLVVCGWLGYGYQDAADLLGVPVGTVRSRLSRARTSLSELIDSANTAHLHDETA